MEADPLSPEGVRCKRTRASLRGEGYPIHEVMASHRPKDFTPLGFSGDHKQALITKSYLFYLFKVCSPDSSLNAIFLRLVNWLIEGNQLISQLTQSVSKLSNFVDGGQ